MALVQTALAALLGDANKNSKNPRSSTLGAILGISKQFSKEFSLEMWRKICTCRAFEFKTAEVYNTGVMKMPIYLSLGEENVPAAAAAVNEQDRHSRESRRLDSSSGNPSSGFQIFAQHRCHSYYLAFGGDMPKLIDELLHRPTGCAKGMGGSASIHSPAIPMYGHSGLMGDQIPVAVGAAYASKKPTLAVVGDASAEEDYIWSAMGYAATKKAPVLLICEDNDLSILTHVSTRRNWSVADVARGLGIPAVDVADDPWMIAHYIRLFKQDLPAVMNVRTVRHLWHAGTGKDSEPEWNRFELVKEELGRLGLSAEAAKIEQESKDLVEKTWQKQLQRP